MFDWLKRRMHKDDDIEDIRSNVIGAPRFDEPDFPRVNKPGFGETPQRFDSDLEDPMAKVSDRRFEQPRFEEPQGFNTIDTRSQANFARNDANYDIADRLNLIESQLAIIRSQTETINERLKNIDAKLSLRRY